MAAGGQRLGWLLAMEPVDLGNSLREGPLLALQRRPTAFRPHNLAPGWRWFGTGLGWRAGSDPATRYPLGR